MSEKNMIKILFVLDTAPDESNSLNFFNSYISLLIAKLSNYVDLHIFYPVISLDKEHYVISVTNRDNTTHYSTEIPPRFPTFSESFANSYMEEIFKEIIKENDFELIHIISLKNHSLNYPFIAKKRNIPTIVSVSDNYLNCHLSYKTSCHNNSCSDCLKVSNFVSSPLFSFLKKLEHTFKNDPSYFWFEHIGRYSTFYNRNSIGNIDEEILEERRILCDEVIQFTDRFHFFSEMHYNYNFRCSVSEDKLFFMQQGIDSKALKESKPFEIDGCVSFGFIGDLLPEEGIDTLIQVFNKIAADGRHNRLHIYGEIYKNKGYFNKLKKSTSNSDIIFHGPVSPTRLDATLSTFDVLIIPSIWHRTDTFLLQNAIAHRKAIITSSKSIIGELVRKKGRGLLLEKITVEALYQSIIDLEINRKKLYYFMRTPDDFSFISIEDNIQELLSHYMSLSNKHYEASDELLLSRKLFRKKVERLRGTA